MKTKFLPSFLCVVSIAIVLSCTSSPQELSPEHEGIIGTRWLTVISNSTDSLEFIDKTYCVFTANNGQQHLRYRVNANRVILGNNILSFELRENTLYLIGYPAYTKE